MVITDALSGGTYDRYPNPSGSSGRHRYASFRYSGSWDSVAEHPVFCSSIGMLRSAAVASFPSLYLRHTRCLHSSHPRLHQTSSSTPRLDTVTQHNVMSSQSDTPASAMTPGAATPATVDNSTSERRPGQGRRGGRGRRYYQQGRRGPGRQQGVTAETTPGAPSGTSQTAQAGPSPGIASLPPRPQRTWNPRWVPQKPRPNLTHCESALIL